MIVLAQRLLINLSGGGEANMCFFVLHQFQCTKRPNTQCGVSSNIHGGTASQVACWSSFSYLFIHFILVSNNQRLGRCVRSVFSRRGWFRDGCTMSRLVV